MIHKFRNWQILFLFLLLLCCGTVLNAQVKVDAARSEWMTGYVKLENGDKASQEGNKMAALQQYREAVVIFENVRRKYPRWNPALLNFRIKYCHQKIEELNKDVQDSADDLTKDKLLELTEKQAKMLHDNALKIQQLDTSVSILTESLQRARSEAAKNAAAESDFANLQAAHRELEGKLRVLEAKNQQLEKDLVLAKEGAVNKKQLQKATKEIQKLTDQVQASAQQLELQQTKIRSLQESLDRSKSDQERQLRIEKDFVKRLDNATEQITQLTNSLNDLHSQHNSLKLKNQQQEVEIRFQKESNGRLAKEKTELQKELQQLREMMKKFTAATSQGTQTSDSPKVFEKQLQELQKAQKEFAEMSRRLKDQDQLLSDRDDDLRKQKERLTAAENMARTVEKQLQELQKTQQAFAEATKQLQDKEKELQKVQQALADVTRQLQEKDQQLQERDGNLRNQAQRLATAESAVLNKSDEAQSLQVELQGTKRKLNDLEKINTRMNEQLTGVTLRLDNFEKENVDLKARRIEDGKLREELQLKLDGNIQELAAKTALSVRLENALAEAEKAKQQLATDLATLRTTISQTKESQAQEKEKILNELNLAQAKSQVFEGLSKNYKDLQDQFASRNREFEKLEQELSAVKIQVSVLEEQLKRRNEQVKQEVAGKEKNAELSAGLQQKLDDSTRELVAKTAQIRSLDAALATSQQAREELHKQYTALLEAMNNAKNLAEENRGVSESLAEKNRGITESLKELQAKFVAQTQALEAAKKELGTSQIQVSVLTEQLKRQAEQLAGSEKKAEQAWLQRLADLNNKLEQEEIRRKALEAALVQKETESRQLAEKAAEEAKQSPQPQLLPPVQSSGNSPVVYTEKDLLINGYIRQGIDAEKNKKIEAAVWNYQKVLELDPAHLLALKRMGLISANQGNDEDTVKYLKTAFRNDPDDGDVLLALGFAMIRMNQPEWAFAYLGRAVALQPQNSVFSRLFGGALADLGWTQAAESQFEKTLKINPKDPHAAFNLAVLCVTANPPRMAEGKKWYELAVKNGAEKDPRLEAELYE